MMDNQVIITAALTGSQGSKHKNSHTPIAVDEIVEDAYQSYLAGASIVHIHVKDPVTEEPVTDVSLFAEVKEKLQAKCDVLLNFSSSGAIHLADGVEFMGRPDGLQADRLAIAETKPDILTLDMATMNFNGRVFMNPLAFLETLAEKSTDLGILNEVEIYDLGDMAQAKRMLEAGVLAENSYFQFCLGIHGGAPATVQNLAYMVDQLPKGAQWSAFGIGKAHLPILFASLALGGHVRVGLEDNLYYRYGELTTNPDLVDRAKRIIREFGKEVATPSDARAILGL